MSVNINKLANEVINDLSIELGHNPDFDPNNDIDPEFDVDILTVKVKSVIRELIQKRGYENTSKTDAEIERDIENYYSTVMNVSRYDYNQRGAEGESSHSENGVSRGYVDRDTLWRGVHTFVKVL